MVLSQVGVALARIGVALFEVGVALATPKVYKSPPLALGQARHMTAGERMLLASLLLDLCLVSMCTSYADAFYPQHCNSCISPSDRRCGYDPHLSTVGHMGRLHMGRLRAGGRLPGISSRGGGL